MSIRRWQPIVRKSLVLLALAPLALAAATADAQNPGGTPPDGSSAAHRRHHRRHAGPPPAALSGTPTEVEAVGPAASASVEIPAAPTKAAKKKRSALPELRQVVSSPGFQMLPDGSSRVEVNVLGSPKVLQYITPGSVVYVFQNALVPLHNNQNPLVTRFFNTPIADTRLRQVGQDVHLIVDLRAQATPQARIIELVPGRVLALQVSFPPGSYAPAAVTDPPRGRSPSHGANRSPTSAAQPAPPTTSDSVLGPPAP